MAGTKKAWSNYINIGITVVVVVFFLTRAWMPLGAQNSLFANFLFVILIVGTILGADVTGGCFYHRILSWCLEYKWTFLASDFYRTIWNFNLAGF